MIDVAIAGAGELGGSLAHVLARREMVRRIELIDPVAQIAAGKALDIAQSGPVERFTTPVVGSTDISRVAGAAVVVVAEGARASDAPDPLLLLKQISQLASRAVVICADTNGRELVERGVRELRYRRERLIGAAPEALASAVRALVALHVNGSVRDVQLAIAGLPPAQTIVNWEDATVGGYAIRRMLAEPILRKLSAQVAALWPPGPHALAHATAETIATICGVSRRTVSCFVAPDDSSGRKARTVALPVRLGAQGLIAVDEPTLDVAARVALENARRL
jgi:malate dehydrogenase